MSDDHDRRTEDGFELGGTFYRWALTDQGKDLMLIDRLTAMPIPEFFALVEEGFDQGRVPLLLAMVATSVRAGHPDWSVERIVRLVMDTNLSEIEFIQGDAEDDPRPPASAQTEEEMPDSSSSSRDGSSSSPTLTANSNSPTSSAAPV